MPNSSSNINEKKIRKPSKFARKRKNNKVLSES